MQILHVIGKVGAGKTHFITQYCAHARLEPEPFAKNRKHREYLSNDYCRAKPYILCFEIAFPKNLTCSLIFLFGSIERNVNNRFLPNFST